MEHEADETMAVLARCAMTGEPLMLGSGDAVDLLRYVETLQGERDAAEQTVRALMDACQRLGEERDLARAALVSQQEGTCATERS